MKIHEVVERLGISKKALQYYEDKGLIEVYKDASGYREYDDACINRLWEIKVLRRLDFSTAEIEQIIRNEQRKEIFQRHYNEIDKRMMLCQIQKDYLHDLYEEIEHTNDVEWLRMIDHDMGDDVERNEQITVDLEKKHSNHFKWSILLLCLIIFCIMLYINYQDEKIRIFCLFVIFGIVYHLASMVQKKFFQGQSNFAQLVHGSKYQMQDKLDAHRSHDEKKL